MKYLALSALLLAACAHGPDLAELQRRIDALEAKADAATAPDFGDRGIYLASLRRPKVEKSLFAGLPSVNCTGPSAACSAASFTTTGTGTFGDVYSHTAGATYTARIQTIGTNTYFYGNDGSTGYLQWNGTIWNINSSGVSAQNTISGGLVASATSGINAFGVLTNGARIDFGSGASDYASSDGTTVTFAGPVSVTGLISGTAAVNAATKFQLGGRDAVVAGEVTTNDSAMVGAVANSAGNSATVIGNTVAMTSGVDRYITTLTRGANGATPAARVFTDGTYQNLMTVGTAASGTGVTANYSGANRTWVHSVTVTSAAMTAAGTTDVSIVPATPVNSAIRRVIADVTQVFTGGALTAVTVMCGKTAGGNEYLLANSVFTAQNTWGDVAAEVGAGLLTATWADFGTPAAGVPGAINVQCRFTCTTANCNAATQGSVTFYVEGVTY